MSKETMKPVAWTDKDFTELIVSEDIAKDIGATVPLYASPPKREPLTDEEIEDEWERVTGHSIFGGEREEGRAMYLSPSEVTEFARAIEAAHGIKE